MLSQALHVAARLSIFDALADGPRTAAQLAAGAAADPTALQRLLRFLTAVDVLREDGDGRFACTARGELFRTDHPSSIHALAVMYGRPFFWRAWGDLHAAVTRGTPGCDSAHGQPFFDYLSAHPDESAVFNAGMTASSRADVPALLAAYDFSRFTCLVDVAGGHGAALRAILERQPALRGILCDREAVLAGAAEITTSGVAARCRLVAADMFQSVPAGGDAYLLKRIVHDWSDGEAIAILRNVRRAMAPHATLLVLEAVLQPPNQPDLAKWSDLNMLALLTGRERTRDDFAALFGAAGFRLTRVIPAGTLSLVEGVGC
jgi:hypothetical protein